MTVPKRTLVPGCLAVLALALILLAALVTNGASDWFELAIALVLLISSYLLRRDARREAVYSRASDERQPDPPT
jgi:hypothetical protein